MEELLGHRDSGNSSILYPPPPPCRVLGDGCAPATVTDSQITSSLWIWTVAGFSFLLLFGALRKWIPSYHTRLNIPNVWLDPPPLRYGTFDRFWSWLEPVFMTSDSELVQTAGLDALMLTWQCMLGIQIFGPLSVLGMAVLLPTNLLGGDVVEITRAGSTKASTVSTFSKLTLSNVQRGSSLFWIPFVFVFIAILYIFWLLLKYYRAYVVLRQHYLTGGETLLNEWHQHFMEKRASMNAARKQTTAMFVLRNLFDVNNQMNELEQDLEDMATANEGVLSGAARHMHRLQTRSTSAPVHQQKAIQRRSGAGRKIIDSSGPSMSSPAHLGDMPPSRDTAGDGEAHQREATGKSLRETYGVCAPQPLPPKAPQALSPTRPRQVGKTLSEIAGLTPSGAPGKGPALQLPDSAEAGGAAHNVSESVDGSRSEGGAGAPGVSDVSTPRGQVGEGGQELKPDRDPGHAPGAGGGRDSQASGPLVGNTAACNADLLGHSAQGRSGQHHSSTRTPATIHAFDIGNDYSAQLGEGPAGGANALSVVREEFDAGPHVASYPVHDVSPGGAPRAAPPRLANGFSRGDGEARGLGRGDPGWQEAGKKLQKRDVHGAADAAAGAVRRETEPRTNGWSKARSRAADIRKLGSNAKEVVPGSLPPVSRYEDPVPPDANVGREVILKWWVTGEKAQQAGTSGYIMGKPNVRDRKIVNTVDAEGREVGVNAQQYVVLVQDVPDLFKERERAHKRTQDHWTWAKIFYNILHFYDTKVTQKKAAIPHLEKAKSQLDNASCKGTEESRRNSQEDDMELGTSRSFARSGAGTANGTSMSTTSEPVVPLPTPFEASSHNGEAQGPDADLGSCSVQDDEGNLIVHPQELVERTFRNLFPDSFLYAVPIYKHKVIDKMLIQWNLASDRLEGAEADFEAATAVGKKARPVTTLGFLGLCGVGEEVDKINYQAEKVRGYEKAIPAARKKILEGPRSDSYFVFFTNQKDAAIAAQVNIHPEDGNSFRIKEAPGPEEVNWSMLWMGYREREVREILVLPLIVAVMLLPIGVFAGTVTQLNLVICTLPQASWYCNTEGSKLVGTVVPPILLTVWQQVVLPLLFYCFAMMEGRWTSLSGVDRRIASLYFFWDVFNVFLGAMLGGSISRLFNIIRTAEFTAILQAIGTSLPSASNFFINFVVLQGFGMVPLRMLYPQINVLTDILLWFGIGRPKSEHDKMDVIWPHSIRHGKEVGGTALIFIVALSYCAASPIILPVALVYFITSWVFWRYSVLYVWERCYESGGRMWDTIFKQIIWCLFILEFFTGCIFIVNAAYIQASLMWIIATTLIWKFANHCEKKFGMAVRNMPLETASLAPHARVPPEMYMPPALRPGCPGWYPEYGKAWEYWGAPAYVL